MEQIQLLIGTNPISHWKKSNFILEHVGGDNMQTDKYIHTHINTMTRTGLEAGPSENEETFFTLHGSMLGGGEAMMESGHTFLRFCFLSPSLSQEVDSRQNYMVAKISCQTKLAVRQN